MVRTLELCKTEDGVGAFLPLPPDVLHHLGVAEGDEVVIGVSNGVVWMRANRDKPDAEP